MVIIALPLVGVRNIAISASVCLFVCLSVRSHISKTHVQVSPDFLYVLPVAVAIIFSSDERESSYVLQVLWVTSCFHTMKRMG